MIADHSSLFVLHDCRIEGTLGIGRKMPNMINSSQNTQGFWWLTRSPQGHRVLWCQQPQAHCGLQKSFLVLMLWPCCFLQQIRKSSNRKKVIFLWDNYSQSCLKSALDLLWYKRQSMNVFQTMSLPCGEESRMQSKVNKGKIRLWLWSVSSPRFLAWLVKRPTTKCCHSLDLGWLFTKDVHSPIGLNVAGVGEGEKSVS